MNTQTTAAMQLVNCTPHPLNIHLAGTGDILTLAPSGTLPRLAVTREPRPALTLPDGVAVAVVRPTLGALTGLPDAVPGVVLIVSALVADAARRADVMSPGELVRDAAGVITGCRGLCSYA